MFTQKKTAQIAAYLASGVAEKAVNYMRLIKLMYLADRESMSRFGEPISYDQMCSMNNGLVLSHTYDVVKSPEVHVTHESWMQYFSPRKGKDDYFLGLNRKVTRQDADCLSDADIEVLNETLRKFGKFDQWELRQYMHDHCAEWKFPDGTSISVDDQELLEILGLPQDEAAATANGLKAERQMDHLAKRR